MSNEKEPMSVSLSKLILTVSMIVSIGALFGAVGFLLSHPQKSIAPTINLANDERCNQKIITNLICSGRGYGFDSDKRKCVVYSPYDNKKGCGASPIFNTLEECQKNCETNFVNSVKEEVVVSTNKAEYEQGEEIKIVVNNGLNKPILYSDNGDRFWGIEYFKEDKWINPNYKEGGFQLTEENTGDACNILLYERAYPTELLSQSNLKSQWNQKICPFTENPYIYKSIARYIESGKYRLIFFYGFEIDSNDEFRILEPKIVYSNEFTIK